LFLHAVELGFEHPVVAESLRWEMPLPEELAGFLASMRSGANNDT
jgi:23S rRNA pseudouridine1911/1915/1917 synthase